MIERLIELLVGSLGQAESSRQLREAIDALRFVEERQLRTRQWWYGILYGAMVGIGGTVGVALVISLALWILSFLHGVPGVDAARDLIEGATN